MTLGLEQQAKLKSVFSAMPQKLVTRMVSVFQTGLASGDSSLPYDILLDLLPADMPEPDLETIFFPVSLLASNTAQRADQIPFQLLRDLWAYYAVEIDPVLSGSWQESAINLRNNRKQLAIGLRKIWEDEGGKARLVAEFGGKNTEKIPLIFSILSFAEEISELVSSWPDEIKELDDRYLLPLRDLNDLLVETDPDITPLLLLMLKTRLKYPQYILRAIERLSRQKSDLVVVNTDMYLIAEVLMDEAEELLLEAKNPIETGARVDEISTAMKRFANIVSGSREEFEISPTSVWGKRLYDIANQAVSFWSRRLKLCWEKIDEATPRVRTKSFLGGSLTGPDLRAPLDAQVSKSAIVNAYLLKQITHQASKIGFSSVSDEINVLVEERLRVSEDNLIDLLGDPGEIGLDILDNHFSTLVKIVRNFHGDEPANIINRRGAAAAAAAAA
ncbi:hypothetical protein MNBD_ALPHA06-736 [hydrothermal vent metagenome]|uniref:Uncharacterized protein n=1 Tax=hydrothermal vent metagenome TaxID=652676 RepID=A0A3B0S4F8_9ZZZZ